MQSAELSADGPVLRAVESLACLSELMLEFCQTSLFDLQSYNHCKHH